jgi:hypothetical protein
LLRETARIRDAFDVAGIAHCFLKGVLMSSRYYGDVDARYTRDIDVMVAAEDRRHAGEVLVASGFRRHSRVLISDAATAPFTHHFEYEGRGFDVELHWSLAEHISYRIDRAAVLRDRTTHRIGNEQFNVPSDEHALLAHLLGAFRDLELGTCTLKPFLDMYCVLTAMDDDTDWHAFFERRRHEGILPIAVNVLTMVLQLWDGAEGLPRFATAISQHNELVKVADAENALELIGAAHRVAARRWAWSLYESNPLKSFCWWAVSLPFRVAVTPKG